MALLVVVVCAVLLGSFLCSLMEASFYSISRAQIETLKRKGDRRGSVLAELRDRADEPIAAILIVNTVMNTAGAALAGALVTQIYGSWLLGWFSAAFTAAILFLSEIVPKSIGFKFAGRTGPMLARPLKLMTLVLWPLVRLCVMITNSFGRNSRISVVSEEDIISMALMSERSGSIHSHEVRWIANALNLDKVSAKDIMTPASVVRRVAADLPLEELDTDAEHWSFSRVPVYLSGEPDRIVGVVQRREVFHRLVEGAGGIRISDLMDPPIFVAESLPAHELLNLFIKYRKHLFCVRDAAARWTGIVTLEDVLETLLGTEIVGEQDLYDDMQEAARQAEHVQLLTRSLMRGGGVIENVVLQPASELSGKRIRDAGLPSQVLIGPILREGAVIVPRGDLALQPGDKITLIGAKQDVAQARRRLEPEAAEPQKGAGK